MMSEKAYLIQYSTLQQSTSKIGFKFLRKYISYNIIEKIWEKFNAIYDDIIVTPVPLFMKYSVLIDSL